MAVSMQTIGVLAMAMMASVGLAVISDVAKQRSVVERMVYYQADEIAMDVEIMDQWEGGTLDKKFGKTYSLTIRNPTAAESSAYTGNPDMLELQRKEVNKVVPIHSSSVEHGSWDEFERLCIEKESMVKIDEGEC